jgi:hypothetical protein
MDPLTTDKFVYTLASSLDVFVIWGILLTAVGLSAAAGKRMPFGKALTAVLIPSVLFILLGATVAKISAG